MEENKNGEVEIKVIVADASHEKYVDEILETISAAAKVRGTGIAKRTHEYVAQKMREGKAVIALAGEQEEFAGFCYIESWGNKQYVANSGLIVVDKFRRRGLAKRIKKTAFDLSRKKWPEAKLFGLTSGGAVMRINTELGYVPVPFAELTDDEAFWRGCEGCINHDILERTGRRYCICTAMLYDPAEKEKKNS
ncbi:MAG: GNAT family N-acetyltransferase [Bacteroidaceae bacterium]|nr:GNAT family N-acetyltransferase [Bacteroidaceae bacterium]MBQ5705967.1 GNAT family N-acetyltransferase [Bacteroidaceae bacterium]MBR5511640.1 GNAT family N-acetyltransferase [Bacteroidaceae bacterium]